MVTTAYVILIVAVALQRLLELHVSRLNEAELKARGAIEHAAAQLPIMAAVHAGWLLSSLLEVLLFDRPFRRWLALLALLVFVLGQALRLLAISALGSRWTVRVITVPGERPVTEGVFRFLRHPNYLGVILEIAALPLVHGAWLTALLFSLANGVLLARRIRAEERALAACSDYEERFRHRPRLWPTLAQVPRASNGPEIDPS